MIANDMRMRVPARWLIGLVLRAYVKCPRDARLVSAWRPADASRGLALLGAAVALTVVLAVAGFLALILSVPLVARYNSFVPTAAALWTLAAAFLCGGLLAERALRRLRAALGKQVYVNAGRALVVASAPPLALSAWFTHSALTAERLADSAGTLVAVLILEPIFYASVTLVPFFALLELSRDTGSRLFTAAGALLLASGALASLARTVTIVVEVAALALLAAAVSDARRRLAGQAPAAAP
jgi:hypothetical protein